MISESAIAQSFAVMGNGNLTTGSTAYNPFYQFTNGIRSQYFVRASELQAAGVPANATIESIGFNILTGATGVTLLEDWQVKVMATSGLPSNTGSTFFSGTVSGQSTPSRLDVSQTGWNQTSISGFVWNGFDNLVIETCFWNSGTNLNYARVEHTNVSPAPTDTRLSRWVADNGSGVCALAGASNNIARRPNIRIGYVSPCAPPAIPAAISGNTTQCPNLSGQTYSVQPVAGATSYTWTAPAGWTITSGQGTASITLTTGGAGQSGILSVSANSACGSSQLRSLPIGMSNVPAATSFINPDSSVCAAGASSYSAASVSGATSYNWTVPTGWSINAGQGTTSISVTAGSVGQNGTISVNASNICGSGPVATLPVIAEPSAGIPVFVNPDTFPCALSTVSYQLSALAGASGYNWTFPTGWNIISGQGTNSVTVNAGNAGQNGNISVSASNNCGSGPLSSIAVRVNTVPASPSLINPPGSACPAASVNFSISGLSGASSYNWIVPTGWSIVNGQGSTSIVATAGNTGQGGNVSVFASNACGNGPAQNHTVNVDSAVGNPVFMNPLASLCTDGSATYNATAPAASAITYSVSGAASINPNSGLVTQPTGNFTVTATASGLCGSPASISFNVAVSQLPDPGTINGPASVCAGASVQLSSTGDTGGSWSSGDQAIAGIDGSGNLTGVSSGNVIISYTIAGGGVCRDSVSTLSVSVDSLLLWFRDTDGDGFGDLSADSLDCLQPAGFVAAGGDCNDGDLNINPGAAEIAGNGIDDDCINGDSISVGIMNNEYDAWTSYPNPGSEFVVLQKRSDIMGDLLFRVHDSGGRLLEEGRMPQDLKRLRLDTGNWSSGIYIIRFSGAANHAIRWTKRD